MLTFNPLCRDDLEEFLEELCDGRAGELIEAIEAKPNGYVQLPGSNTWVKHLVGSARYSVIINLITIDQAVSGDELLTALAALAPEDRETALVTRGVDILRAAADLCGVESSGLTKRQAIAAILANF
jgi:hypothetical protein